MTHDEMIAVLQAAKDGKAIQWCSVRGELAGKWFDFTDKQVFNFGSFDYRVKPEPKTIWVNEYIGNSFIVFSTEEKARQYAGTGCLRIAVRYIEATE